MAIGSSWGLGLNNSGHALWVERSNARCSRSPRFGSCRTRESLKSFERLKQPIARNGLKSKRPSGRTIAESYTLELDAELDAAKQAIAGLEAENENLKANQSVLFTGDFSSEDLADDVPDEAESLESVESALRSALKTSTNIEVLPSAYSAAGESPFKRPADIHRALVDLDEIVDAWRNLRAEKGSGGDLAATPRDSRGWRKRSSMHISDTTKGKFRSHYEFEYQGVKQLFEPHITIGSGGPNSCASIHFIFDQAREKIIVAHVGKHLPNTKT